MYFNIIKIVAPRSQKSTPDLPAKFVCNSEKKKGNVVSSELKILIFAFTVLFHAEEMNVVVILGAVGLCKMINFIFAL